MTVGNRARNGAKTGVLITGLAMGLGGCMSTLEEDIPFVSRFNSGDQTSAAADEGGGDAKAGNPFAGLFDAVKSGSETDAADDTQKTSRLQGGFASLFKPKDTMALSADTGAGTSAPTAEEKARAKEAAESLIISNLQTRRSILPRGSAYDQVASSVLAANSRAAEAELRAARLRAVAASKNWLPTIGPSISLSSLGDLVADLIVEQVLFDNGRKKAERAFAAADVEVAAVTLAQDTNTRVFTALDLYLKAQTAARKTQLARTAFNDMSHFEYIMSERVRGGVSDRSDLVVLRQKLAEIKSDMAANTEGRTAAIAELNAMSVRDLSSVSGVPSMSVNGLGSKPLPILLAEAEKERAVAEATMERASNLPGLKAVGSTGTSGDSLGLRLASDKLFGLGTGDTLKAIEATKEGAQRKVAQAREDSNRRLRALEAQLSGAQRQAKEAEALSVQSKKNLDLFQAQYKAGTRQVMDVVGVYETYARQQQSAADLQYKADKIKLEIANEMGLLASGAEI